MEYPCCHGCSNKPAVRVVELSWVKETVMIIGFTQEINSSLLCESPVLFTHPPSPTSSQN